jgi:hypothetical protein
MPLKLEWTGEQLTLVQSLQKKNKNVKVKKTIVMTQKTSENPRLKDAVSLKLTAEKSFSMYLFDKPNKGFTNLQKVNCFMNVCLQSLMASPAFFNLIQAIADTPDIKDNLKEDGLLIKMVALSEYFKMSNQIDKKSKFAKNVIDGETLF